MKKYFLFILLAGLSFTTHAQSKEEKKVAAAVEALNAAILHPDKERLSALTVEQLSYGHSNGKIQNKSVFIDDLTHGSFHFLTITTAGQIIQLAGNNAIVRHIFTADFTNNGVSGNLKIGNLLIWQKHHGSWKLLARQAYKL